ncbi:MAG: 1-acyl-sn-glycerol-3-phosphate acyltransferase [Candidatus Aureabacteria bacterium]|nr:1-acyl-sn-glycerol-3-phosphate acyltransferase [Candidatus Auribacterota bacterium]
MLYIISCFLSKTFARIFWGFKGEGMENVPKQGPAIIACNHSSYVDPPLVGCLFKRKFWFMARKTLFKGKIIKRYLEAIHAMPIDNKGSDIGALKLILKKLKKCEVVVIFPEGTRSPDGTIREARQGIGAIALKTGVPVIPAYIHNANKAWPKNSKFPKFGVKVKVFFGNPITFSQSKNYSKEDSREIATRIMDSIKFLREEAVKKHGT